MKEPLPGTARERDGDRHGGAREGSTIFALSSGTGMAGVAVIRLSGPFAADTLTLLAGPLPEPRFASLRPIRSPATREPLDRALVFWFPRPASFTGEDMVELHVHGGRAVVAAVLDLLARRPGLRAAEPGEFTRRAFENGKIDLTEAEGLADLIAAETEAQRRQALAQCSGALRTLYDGWRADLIHALAFVEAELDFADESDVPGRIAAEARPIVDRMIGSMRTHLDDGNRGEILRQGVRVAIAGPPNAGKSSLLNALARRDVAIVSPEAGTTRDVVEARLDLGGYAVLVSDTAGLREAQSAVEAEGIRRSHRAASEADLVLWLVDPAHPAAPVGVQAKEVWTVFTKCDLHPATSETERPDGLIISALTGAGLPELVARIAEFAGARAGDGEGAVITRSRHRAGVQQALGALEAFAGNPLLAPELGAEELRRAAHALGRIVGRVDVEDVLDAIFSSFCIGK